jgi:hypothetical protein
MNVILFRSSLICSLIHIYYIIDYFPISNNTFLLLIYSGILSSIMNHSYNKYYIQLIDRIIMHIGIWYNIYLLYVLNMYIDIFLMFFCGYLYILSRYLNYKNKIKKNIYEIPHVLSHFLLTYIHINLIKYYTLDTCEANP